MKCEMIISHVLCVPLHFSYEGVTSLLTEVHKGCVLSLPSGQQVGMNVLYPYPSLQAGKHNQLRRLLPQKPSSHVHGKPCTCSPSKHQLRHCENEHNASCND